MREEARILVVDDEDEVRQLVAEFLEAKGYSVITAATGFEALTAVKHYRPDLVLMDVMMPTMDGLTACQKIRAQEKKGQRTPILFLTARDSQHDKLSSALSGGDDFISKPISLQELRERVEAALAHARKR